MTVRMPREAVVDRLVKRSRHQRASVLVDNADQRRLTLSRQRRRLGTKAALRVRIDDDPGGAMLHVASTRPVASLSDDWWRVATWFAVLIGAVMLYGVTGGGVSHDGLIALAVLAAAPLLTIGLMGHAAETSRLEVLRLVDELATTFATPAVPAPRRPSVLQDP